MTLPGGLRAEDASDGRTPGLAALDTNGDGLVARDEVPEDRRQLFDRLLGRADKNEDGQLSLDELKVAFRDRDRDDDDRRSDDRRRDERRREDRKRGDDRGRPEGREGDGPRPDGPRPDGPRGDRPMPPPSPLLRTLDTDRDGRLSADEIAAASESLKKLDRDDDGEISQREFFIAFRELGPGPQPDGPPRGPRPDGPRPDGPPARGPQADRARAFLERLKEADEDGDHRLSREEAPERMRERFDRIDTNHDDYIDMEEIHVMFKRVMDARAPEARPDDRPKQKPDGDSDKAKKKKAKQDKKKKGKPKDKDQKPAEAEGSAAEAPADTQAASPVATAPL
jgi:collagen type III alpha